MRTALIAAALMVLVGAGEASGDLPARLSSGEEPWWQRPAVATIDRGLVVLPGDVLFNSDADTLTPAAQALLGEIVTRLDLLPDSRLLVVGHTDRVGGADSNLALSLRRARAVATHLIELGVPAGALIVDGAGERRPVAPGDADADRRANRRVELELR